MDDPERAIRDTILRMAANNGEPHPHGIAYVATTRGAAGWELSRAVVVGDVELPVYAIAAQGHFVGYLAKIPRGASPPTGRNLVVVIDAAGGDVCSWGINDLPLDLTTLGTPVELADAAPWSQ